MNKSISEIQESLTAALNAMPDVFSTVQWGGRAYKLPGPGSRGRKKPALLAHVWIHNAESSIGVAFKLEPKRARAMTRKHKWIAPHSFRTLAPSGWVIAEVHTKSQCKALIELLHEARAAHPVSQDATPVESTARNRKRDTGSHESADANRIDAVLRRKRDEGWNPQDDQAFDRV